MNWRSIRFRLTLWYTSILLSGLILFSVGSWLTLKRATASAKNTTLLRREQRLVEALNLQSPVLAHVPWKARLAMFSLTIPESNLVQAFDLKGTRLFPETASVKSLSWPGGNCADPCFGESRLNGHPIGTISHLARINGQLIRICIGASLDEHENVLRRYRASLFAMIPLLCLLSITGGYTVSRRALLPVDQLTRASQRIGFRDLSARLPAAATSDEVQRLTEAWNGLLDRLQTAVSQLTQFTADVSHDLRTAITVMLTTGQLALKRPRSEEDYREALQTIVGECASTVQLLDDLLVLARADAYSSRIQKKPLDLAEIVSASCERMQGLAEAKRQNLICDLPPSSPFEGDQALLGRLTGILVDNAIKYTLKGGTIKVKVAHFGSTSELRVEDTGIGIPPEILPRIFDRFFRADPVRNRDGGGGSGLGLTIAKWIADVHGAKLTVQSTPGAGTVFTVSFVLTDAG